MKSNTKPKHTNRKRKAGSATAHTSPPPDSPLGASLRIPKLVSSSRGGKMLALRSRLGLNREVFARMLPISTRSLATIESGSAPAEPVIRKLVELRRVVDALEEVIDKDAVGPWLTAPNNAFAGLKPLEVIERGEVDRIWQMIFFLRSGTPS